MKLQFGLLIFGVTMALSAGAMQGNENRSVEPRFLEKGAVLTFSDCDKLDYKCEFKKDFQTVDKEYVSSSVAGCSLRLFPAKGNIKISKEVKFVLNQNLHYYNKDSSIFVELGFKAEVKDGNATKTLNLVMNCEDTTTDAIEDGLGVRIHDQAGIEYAKAKKLEEEKYALEDAKVAKAKARFLQELQMLEPVNIEPAAGAN